MGTVSSLAEEIQRRLQRARPGLRKTLKQKRFIGGRLCEMLARQGGE